MLVWLCSQTDCRVRDSSVTKQLDKLDKPSSGKDVSRTVASPMATIELCLRRLFGRLRAGALLGAVRSPMVRLRSIDTISKWSRALLSSARARHNRKPRSHNEACRSIRSGGDDVSRLRSAVGTTQHGGPVKPPKHTGRAIYLGNVFALQIHLAL